jgi:hypothetical protein
VIGRVLRLSSSALASFYSLGGVVSTQTPTILPTIVVEAPEKQRAKEQTGAQPAPTPVEPSGETPEAVAARELAAKAKSFDAARTKVYITIGTTSCEISHDDIQSLPQGINQPVEKVLRAGDRARLERRRHADGLRRQKRRGRHDRSRLKSLVTGSDSIFYIRTVAVKISPGDACSLPSVEASMRVALVGFSSPVAYDYRNQATEAPADQESSPNPILFGGSSVMLLFDQIWFMTRSLCPESMRNLNFVRFLDETGQLTSEIVRRAKEEFATPKAGPFLHSLDENVTERIAYQQVKDSFLTKNDFVWDNHTHSLNVLGNRVLGNSGSEYTLALDRGIKILLKEPNVELIYNPFWLESVEAEARTLAQVGLSNELLLKRIPNPFNSRGPVVDDIYKWRDNNFIGDYRNWLSSQTFPKDLGKLKELSERLENDIFNAMRKSYLEELKKSKIYTSIAKSVLGELAGFLVPGSSLLYEIAKDAREEAKAHEERWRAFLLSLETPDPNQ